MIIGTCINITRDKSLPTSFYHDDCDIQFYLSIWLFEFLNISDVMLTCRFDLQLADNLRNVQQISSLKATNIELRRKLVRSRCNLDFFFLIRFLNEGSLFIIFSNPMIIYDEKSSARRVRFGEQFNSSNSSISTCLSTFLTAIIIHLSVSMIYRKLQHKNFSNYK